jgi:hypothetical protein
MLRTTAPSMTTAPTFSPPLAQWSTRSGPLFLQPLEASIPPRRHHCAKRRGSGTVVDVLAPSAGFGNFADAKPGRRFAHVLEFSWFTRHGWRPKSRRRRQKTCIRLPGGGHILVDGAGVLTPMLLESLKIAVRRLRGAASPGAPGLSDRQLLQRFRLERDESAFAALLERHGGMVLGVCRRELG